MMPIISFIRLRSDIDVDGPADLSSIISARELLSDHPQHKISQRFDMIFDTVFAHTANSSFNFRGAAVAAAAASPRLARSLDHASTTSFKVISAKSQSSSS
jgi:hypothetical protein